MRLSRFILVWLLAAWVALAGMPAFAAGRVALIVANSTYDAAPLSNPATDAGLVAPVLERMGFEVTTVTDVDLATFDRTLREFEQKAEGADIAAFYFAGHGFAVNDGINVRNYLMSTSADVTSRSDRVIRAGGIPLDEIVASLSTSAKTSLIFVDACRNDPRVRAGAGGGRGLAPLPGGLGNAVFVGLSTRLGDTATDGEPGKGSPFARAFAAHMAEPGSRVIDAFTRVRLAVAEETGADQNPEIARQDLTAPLVLVAPPPAVAEAPEETDLPTPPVSEAQPQPQTPTPSQSASQESSEPPTEQSQTASLTPDAETTGGTAPWMGVRLNQLRAVPGYLRPTSGSKGVVVTGVLRDGPANGKLRLGDVVTEINGTDVSEPTDLAAVFDTLKAGDTVNLTVDRGTTEWVSFVLGSADTAETLNRERSAQRLEDVDAIMAHNQGIGLEPGKQVQIADVRDLPPALRSHFGNPERGVIILSMTSEAQQQHAWLAPGMIIDQVDLYDIDSLEYFLDTANRFRDAGMANLTMRVRYQGDLYYSALPLAGTNYVKGPE